MPAKIEDYALVGDGETAAWLADNLVLQGCYREARLSSPTKAL